MTPRTDLSIRNDLSTSCSATGRTTWMRALVFALAGLLAATAASAIGFLTPVDGLPLAEARVITVDGRVLVGEVPNDFWGFRGLKYLTLREADGTKHRLWAGEIRSVIVPLDPISRFGMYADATTTIEKAIFTDYEQIEKVEEVVFDSLPWPDDSRRVLIQRVNPGFDRALQVYALGNAQELTFRLGRLPLWGDEQKAYLVARNGGTPIKVKKRTYEDQFEQIFGDCPALLAAVPEDDRDFRDFADHVAAYDRTCY